MMTMVLLQVFSTSMPILYLQSTLLMNKYMHFTNAIVAVLLAKVWLYPHMCVSVCERVCVLVNLCNIVSFFCNILIYSSEYYCIFTAWLHFLRHQLLI